MVKSRLVLSKFWWKGELHNWGFADFHKYFLKQQYEYANWWVDDDISLKIFHIFWNLKLLNSDVLF